MALPVRDPPSILGGNHRSFIPFGVAPGKHFAGSLLSSICSENRSHQLLSCFFTFQQDAFQTPPPRDPPLRRERGAVRRERRAHLQGA